jgi:hypothetical protein
MGAGLVMRVYEGPHAGLTPNARHVLIRMAVSAMDCDPEPSYWAGWQPLAEALCLRGKEETNRSKVRRYMRELHTAGAITLTVSGNQYHATIYRLWLNMPAPRNADGLHPECLSCAPDPVETVDNSASGRNLPVPKLGPANDGACTQFGSVPVPNLGTGKRASLLIEEKEGVQELRSIRARA